MSDFEKTPGPVLARITVLRFINDDGMLIDRVEAVGNDGEPIALTEALGMMRLAEDTLIRRGMGEEPEDDG